MVYYANMQKINDDHLISQLERLRIAVQSGELSQSKIAIDTGVHQSQVSRILSGHGKLASKNTLKLCKYITDLHSSDLINKPIDQRLLNAIQKIWDGSNEHAAYPSGHPT